MEVLLAQRQKEINAWREREQAEFEQANRTAPQMQAELTGGGAGRLRGLNAAKPTAAELWDRGVPELMTGVASAPAVYKESAELAEYMAITDALYQKQHAAAAFLGASKDSLVPTGEGALNTLGLGTSAFAGIGEAGSKAVGKLPGVGRRRRSF